MTCNCPAGTGNPNGCNPAQPSSFTENVGESPISIGDYMKGDPGTGIQTVSAKTISTNSDINTTTNLVELDTTLTDGTTQSSNFTVQATNGNEINSVSSSVVDSSGQIVDVTQLIKGDPGIGISSVVLNSAPTSTGSSNSFIITYTDGSSTTTNSFTITNGKDGIGITSIQVVNQ